MIKRKTLIKNKIKFNKPKFVITKNIHIVFKPLFLIFYIITISLQCFSMTLNEPLYDGMLVKGKLNTDEKIWFNKRQIIPHSDGTFYFGIPQGHTDTLILKYEKNTPTGIIKTQKKFEVKRQKWKETKINGLPKNKVNISTQNQERIKKENILLKEKRTEHNKNFFPICFTRPIASKKYRISGDFGARRILNGITGSGHSGTDYAAPTGTSIISPADGIIVVAHNDMFLSGKTILINHGYGIFSSYSHLSKISVQSGKHIKRGEKIGEVGSTGRSTGPHLHFTLTWFDIRVDPEQVFNNYSCTVSK